MSSNKFSRQYYFAFGSNMHLTQMAERCPGSTFIGKATLRGYRWQINQRHVANIVKVTDGSSSVPAEQGDVVEGLVFSITDKDRRILDRKEGIKLGVYERVVLNVFLERHPHFAENKTAYVRERLQDGSQQGDLAMHDDTEIGENAADAQSKPSVLSKKPPPSIEIPPVNESENINAITYLSTKYAENGLIRLEYVQRMENAISDALKLGVSPSFVKRCLEPYVHGEVYQPEDTVEEKPASVDAAVSQVVLEEVRRKAKGKTDVDAATSQQPDQTKRARKKSHGTDFKTQRLRNEDRESRRTHARSGDERAISKKDDKGSTGFWSSVSSMFGSGQSQGGTKTPQDR